MKKAEFKNGLKGKGFTAALVLSLCAVGISAYMAYDGAMNRLTAETEDNAEDNVFIFSDETEDVSAEKLDIPKETEATEPKEEEADTAGLVFENPKTLPVSGEVINPYSNGELVKSETLGVWKTHDGVDIAAEAGTAVASMMKGTVTEVNDDPLWGICVIIDHGDGVMGHYYNLSETVNVKIGQEVSMGEIIGSVGNTADVECKLPSHFHFGVTENGAWCDPIAFVER